MTTGQSHLLRILIDESDWWRDSLLYEAILTKAEELKFEKPSLLYGIMGFGWNRRIRRRKHWIDLFGLTQRCPIAIEIADADHRLAKFLPFVEDVVAEGLITLEDWDSSEAGEEWQNTGDWSWTGEVPAIAQFGRSATRLRVRFHPAMEQSFSLHARLVQKARDMELTGATVFPDVGPDDKTELHNLQAFVQSRDSRLIAEFVDDPVVIERFAQVVREIAPAATLATTDVRYMRRIRRLAKKANG